MPNLSKFVHFPVAILKALINISFVSVSYALLTLFNNSLVLSLSKLTVTILLSFILPSSIF